MNTELHVYAEILEPIEKRLREVQHFISETEKHYFDPELFNINLNAAIQSSRNVTFVIQSQKSLIEEFDQWYSYWQQKMKEQPLLRWLVNARNFIVKQGDLKFNSVLRVGFVLSYYDIPQKEFSVPLRYNVKKILKRVKPESIPIDVLQDSFLRIERRWVSNDLPDWEVITVLGYGHTILDTLVKDLKCHILKNRHAIPHFPPPPKKDPVFDPKVILIRMKDGAVMGGITEKKLPNLTNKNLASEKQHVIDHYGIDLEKIPKNEGGSDLLGIAKTFMDLATKILIKDGHHISMAMLIPDSGVGKMVGIEAKDNAEKFLIWRNIADDVRRTGITKIITASEIWTAEFDKNAPFRRAADAPNRGEALQITVAAKDGTLISLVKKFDRTDNGFEFAEIEIQEGVKAYFLEPVREVWGLPPFEKSTECGS